MHHTSNLNSSKNRKGNLETTPISFSVFINFFLFYKAIFSVVFQSILQIQLLMTVQRYEFSS